MRKRAVAVKGIRLELPAELMASVRAASSGDTLSRWALNALAAGFSARPEDIRAARPDPTGERESLFLELPPEFLARLDGRAVHVNMKRSEFARACFNLAVRATRGAPGIPSLPPPRRRPAPLRPPASPRPPAVATS